MHQQHQSTRLGGRAYAHHEGDDGTETEYNRLRDLARSEASKRNSCFDRAHEAYEQGDGAKAKQLSNEGKAHGAKMEQCNKQASEYIFRANNSPDKLDDNTIDLHGQYVEEAEDILEARIRDAQARNQTHLHVIVGKGIHSANHVQKLKPRVEQLCRELGLQYRPEECEGRIYVNLQGHDIHEIPQPPSAFTGRGHDVVQSTNKPQDGQQHARPPDTSQQEQQEQQEQHQQGQETKLDKTILSKVSSKLGDCCVVM